MQGWELVVVAGAVVLLLGASRLPKLARSFGEARRELAKVRAENDDDAATTTTSVAPATPIDPPVSPADPLPPPLPPPNA